MFPASMDFRLEHTDGPAQQGILHLENHMVRIPSLLFIQTKQFLAPNYADMILCDKIYDKNKPMIYLGKNRLTESYLDDLSAHDGISSFVLFPKDLTGSLHNWIQDTWPSDNIDCRILTGNRDVDTKQGQSTGKLFIVGSAQQLLRNPVEYVEYLTTLRESIPYDSMVYFPASATPKNCSLLIYCGIDLLDTTQAIIAARKNVFFFPTGNFHKDSLTTIPCNCPSCKKQDTVSEMTFEDILDHNYYMMYQEMQLVRTSIKNHNLRRLVELRIGADPLLTTILRNLDDRSFSYLEKRTSLHNMNTLYATTFESLKRPEIARFQKRVLHQYEKPMSASVLLILPCSMKKPYSFSQSHKKFHDAILSSKNPYCIHELILTSPVGLVPRELECIYPASNYDIPVTGTWYKEEQSLFQTMLQGYLRKNTYDTIIVHLPKEMNSFIKDIIPNALYTDFTGSPNGSEALTHLRTLIQQETDKIARISGKQRWHDHMISLASYQFTKPLAESLLKNTKVTGKYPYLKILDEQGKQLGMTTEKRGYISLTLEGGKRLVHHEKYQITLTSDFSLKGSVFAPGIKDADPAIRKGDEVLVIQHDSLQAVGVAMMNGEEMKKRSHGEAVKVRHKAL